MPRCYECSKVALPAPFQFDSKDLRTWSSGPELIRSAESGCDLCAFIRKDIEKVSAANMCAIHHDHKQCNNEAIVICFFTTTSSNYLCHAMLSIRLSILSYTRTWYSCP